jgi:hypothetical protein
MMIANDSVYDSIEKVMVLKKKAELMLLLFLRIFSSQNGQVQRRVGDTIIV